MTPTLRYSLVIVVALVLSAAACGGDETTTAAPTDVPPAATPTQTSSPTPTPTRKPTPTITPTATPIPVAEAAEHYEAGLALQRQGRLKEAMIEYDSAIRLNPGHVMAYYNRGIAYYNLDRHGSAIDDFGEAIHLDPGFADAFNNRGAAYYQLGQYQRAIEGYDLVIILDSKNVDAHYNRGIAYGKLDRHRRAIEDFDKAIRLDPEYAAAYRNRGLAYSALEQYEEAAEDLEEALRLDPEDASAAAAWVEACSFLVEDKYLLTRRPSNWIEAENEARGRGGHLVTINSREEQKLLVSLFLSEESDALPFIGKTLWIGLRQPSPSARFEWVSGQPVTYTNWRFGEPNNFVRGEDYAVMNWHLPHGRVGILGDWNDVPLERINAFLFGAENYSRVPGSGVTRVEGLDEERPPRHP